ncbi:MAG: hypothetical protein L6V93_00160 [Clostridiales bacterium]|nr:MAG: hypothetical protein L6V93_00160 [Clostridiales bacterium]
MQHTALNKLHSKVAEVEKRKHRRRSGTPNGAKGGKPCTVQCQNGKNTLTVSVKLHRTKKAARLKVKAEKAEIKAAYEKNACGKIRR